MIITENNRGYKILISIIFGLLGFFSNFQTLMFPLGDYTVAILLGLLFPLLIALSWGWRYGLLSALSGGCQTMWWVWGPSNGYAVFMIVPPFTLWVVWHGLFAEIRKKQTMDKWWLNKYVVEIPFRLLSTLNLLTLTRWAVSQNPPAWSWASNATNTVPMDFSIFVAIKQASVAYILLIFADVLLNANFVRNVLRLKQDIDHRKTGHIISIFLIMALIFWVLDSLIHAFVFHKTSTFIELLATNIPDHNLFTRLVFVLFCLSSGLITSRILRRQREGELALKESEEELYQIIQGSYIPTYVIDKDNTIIHWNKAAEKLTGASAAEMIGTTNHWKPFYSTKSTMLADCIVAGVTEQEIQNSCGKQVTKSPLIKNAYQKEQYLEDKGEKGTWLFFTATPLKDNFGVIKGAIETIQDITIHKQAQEDVKASAALLKNFIHTIPDLVWLKDPQGVFLLCNSRFESLFGAKESDIIGKTDYDFVNKELADFFRQHDQLAMAKGSPSINEEEVTFAEDGHSEILETIKTPIYDDAGELTGVLGIGRNITERVSLLAQLVQAQKMESVGRLAGGVAHDFNNMLSVIMGNAEMVLDDLEATNPAVTNLNEIQNAAERSANLTRQLLAFARKQTIEPKVLNINQTIEGMLKMIRRLVGEGIHLSWKPETDIWPVKMDPSQVDQLLVNLCVNARDAIKNTGRITIETNNVHFDQEYCLTHAEFHPGDYVALTVSDDGCGMDKNTIENLFEPFFTTKKTGEGTGLGLATAYGIIKQNKGFINVYSELDIGTTFKLYLARYSGAESKENLKQSKSDIRGGQETILIVEDDSSILRVIAAILKKLGYVILTANTPEKALQISNDPTIDEIHLLLTDVIMPEMNGRDLATKLQEKRPTLKCLYMSGYTANIIAHHGVLDEGLSFISKPFSSKDLSFKVRRILDNQEHRPTEAN